MPTTNFTPLYEIGDQIVFYRDTTNSPLTNVVIGEIVDISYNTVDNEIVYDILASGKTFTNILEANVFAVSDTFQRLVDIIIL